MLHPIVVDVDLYFSRIRLDLNHFVIHDRCWKSQHDNAFADGLSIPIFVVWSIGWNDVLRTIAGNIQKNMHGTDGDFVSKRTKRCFAIELHTRIDFTPANEQSTLWLQIPQCTGQGAGDRGLYEGEIFDGIAHLVTRSNSEINPSSKKREYKNRSASRASAAPARTTARGR